MDTPTAQMVPAWIDPDGLDAVRARPAVLIFESRDDQTILVGAAGDGRAFCLDRVGDDAKGRTDLRGLTRRIGVIEVGSGFEADWVCREHARERVPSIYRALADRWRAWFVHLDPSDDPPVRRKVHLGELEGSEPRVAPWLIGPIAEKDGAGRLGEAIDDVFSLCRYPTELAKAPDGRACAYKDMGQCPAACDGSESMETYRSRAYRAVDFFSTPHDEARDQLTAKIEHLAATQDFEAAGEAKRHLGSLDRFKSRAFASRTTLDRLGVVAVFASPKRGHARVFAATRGRVACLMDVHGEAERGAAGEIAESVGAWMTGVPEMSFDRSSLVRMGLVCRHLFVTRKRRGGIVSLDTARQSVDPAWMRAAIRSAANTAETQDTDIDTMELESE